MGPMLETMGMLLCHSTKTRDGAGTQGVNLAQIYQWGIPCWQYVASILSLYNTWVVQRTGSIKKNLAHRIIKSSYYLFSLPWAIIYTRVDTLPSTVGPWSD